MGFVIGFTNVYFTLWSVKEDNQYTKLPDGRCFLAFKRVHYTFHRNLSKDKDNALSKFKKLTKVDKIFDEVFDGGLRGKTRSFSENISFESPAEYFHRGKYSNTLISECTDINYLKWFANYFTLSTDRFNIIKERLEEFGYVELDRSFYTKEEYDQILINQKQYDEDQKIISDHFFMDGEKVELEVVLHKSESWNSFYGVKYRYEFRFDGKRIEYIGQTPKDIVEGEKYRLIGTVKHHVDFDGLKSTRILRMKAELKKDS